MALQIADRVQVTATANTTVSFTLGSAVTGYQSFATAGITNGNTVFYGSSDGTNWEVGIGIYSSTGPTLTRSTILSSSNSGSAVSTFGSSVNVWIDYPSSQAVYNDPLNGVVTPSTSIFNNNIVDKQLYLQGGNNLITYSQAFTGATWFQTYAGGGVTVTDNNTTAPDGTSTAAKILAQNVNNSHGLYEIATYAAATYTYSQYFKAGTYNFVTLDFSNTGVLGATFNLSTGTVGFTNANVTSSITSVGSGWYRCSITTAIGTAGTNYPEFYLSGSGTANTRSWSATGTEYVYTWGAQLELGSVASSYTPTTTTAVTTTNNISVPSGSVAIGGTTNSTSNTTGALTVVGGIGSSSNIYASGGANASTSPTTGGIWAYQPYPAFAGGFLNSPVIGFTASAWNSASGAVASQAYMQLNALTFNVNPPTSKLSFYISANGASPTEKMYLSSAGALTTTADSTFNTVTVGLGGGNVSTNMAVGYQALNATATGGNNTGLGYQVLASLTGGVQNVAIGSSALLSNNNGNQNIGIGQATLYANTSGNQNTGVGHNALRLNISGSNNIAIGYNSLWYNTTASANTAVGWQSLYNNTITGNLTAIGYGSLQNNTTNVATLGTITGGTGYTAGTYTGVVMTLSSGSTATTYPTATIVVSGGAVTSVTLTSNGVGFKDTTTVLTAPAASIGGTGSGFSVPVASLASGTQNTAVGYQALTANTVATGNTATGFQCLVNTTSGRFNVGYGAAAGYANTTGAYNVFVGGQNAGGIANGNANTSGNYLTAVGAGALASNSTSNALTGIGYMALYSATGGNNTAIGYQAGYAGTALTTGTNNIFVGYQAQASTAADTNEIVIGYNQTGLGSNTTVIGNSSTTLSKVFGVITSTVYTVATLPSASTSGAGARAFVSDALSPTFGATVTGGGAVNVPVYSDGTNWKVG